MEEKITKKELSDLSNAVFQCDVILDEVGDMTINIKNKKHVLVAYQWLQALRDDLSLQVFKLTPKEKDEAVI